MQSKQTSFYSFLVVVGLHAGVLAAVVLSPSKPVPVEIAQPTIQGVLVMAEPKEEMPPPPELPPPPEKKPEPKPKPKPVPKAPPSERAIKAPEPEPEPVPVVETPPEPKVEPTPAPVIPPRAEAGQLNNPAPVYPKQSRRLREEGIVVLEILIKANGTVGEIRLKESSGYKRLDSAAIQAVKHWRYQPASQGGKAIDFWYEQPIEFNLN